MTISDQNLELLPDYRQRIEVLRQLNYIDDQGTVQLKGRVACEINSADELLLTELVLDNVFADYEPAEVVALLSCFVFQERNASEPRLTPKLTKGKEVVLEYARKVAQLQVDCGLAISVEDYANSLRFGLVEVVYEWARGLAFKQITDLTDVLEGSIVRCISRLDETCREVMGAARMVGDTSLYKKMEQAEQDIKRDIVFAASLVSTDLHAFASIYSRLFFNNSTFNHDQRCILIMNKQPNYACFFIVIVLLYVNRWCISLIVYQSKHLISLCRC